jgi:hypothetical protein
MTFHKVKDHPGLIRDSHTNAVLNIDKNVLSKHKQIMSERERRERMESELNTLTKKVDVLTDLLQELIKREK